MSDSGDFQRTVQYGTIIVRYRAVRYIDLAAFRTLANEFFATLVTSPRTKFD